MFQGFWHALVWRAFTDKKARKIWAKSHYHLGPSSVLRGRAEIAGFPAKKGKSATSFNPRQKLFFYSICYRPWMGTVYNFIWNKLCTFHASLQNLKFKYFQNILDYSNIIQQNARCCSSVCSFKETDKTPLGFSKYLCTSNLQQFRQSLCKRRCLCSLVDETSD